MNVNNRRPVFVPLEFRREVEKLSKAALMDMVWDYAEQAAGKVSSDATLAEFRARREIILAHRDQEHDR